MGEENCILGGRTAAQKDEGFFRIVFDGSGHHVEKEFFTVEYKHCNLPEAQIRTTVLRKDDHFEVTLTADCYAFFVLASLTETFCRFSDNLITLYPEKTVTLKAWTKEEITCEEFAAQLDVKDLRRSY